MNDYNRNSWTATANKVLTIFIIVTALHLLIVLMIGWFNTWRNSIVSENFGPPVSAQKRNDPIREQEDIPPQDDNTPPALEAAPLALDMGLPPSPETSNTKDISPLLDEAELPQQPLPKIQNDKHEPERKTYDSYTVAERDTLYEIALKYGISVNELREENHIDNDLIRTGQKLAIPKADDNRNFQPASDSPAYLFNLEPPTLVNAAQTSKSSKTYVVKKNDTLNKISRLFNINPEELTKMNSIKDPSRLKTGMMLKIPDKHLRRR